MAFVVIQHLPPAKEAMLPELLASSSPIPVVQVTEGARVEPNHVYVIPPSHDMSIAEGALHLHAPRVAQGIKLPIDFFFTSLAEDLEERSVGVLLSGMGTDGTQGLRAIHDKGGAVFVQAPAAAKFDSMPRSAIDAGIVDVVASAEELPGRIVEYLRHGPHERAELAVRAGGSLEKIVALLRTATGHDFSLYKPSTLARRIERRMGMHQISDPAAYARYLRKTPEEARLLFRELLIGVTSFFRDREAWERLKTEVLAKLVTSCAPHAVLRAWVPACSTGEEAYSLAIAFREAVDQHARGKSVALQIFATDLDATAIERARQGVYPASIAADVSPERLRRFFVKEGGTFRVRKDVRDLLVFATQNVLQDPPFTRLNLLCCRNLLIYVTAEMQRKIIPLFHYSLRPGGVLFLGSAETIGGFTDLFAPIVGNARLYRRLEPVTEGPRAVEFPPVYAQPVERATSASAVLPSDGFGGSSPSTLQARVERLLFDRYAPAAVLVSRKGDVLYVSGRTGRYLELPAGRTNWNVLAMAREGLRRELGAALSEVARTKGAVRLSGIEVHADHAPLLVDVALEPIEEPTSLRGTVLVAFADALVPAGVAGRKQARRAESSPGVRHQRELALLRDELRRTQDDAQAGQEELKSANEELQSTNEELQSTNEELTTSKEEMQSMNEELQTLNDELQAKVDDLTRASNDMKNLLDSTAIAVIFLDEALNVRRFTPQVASLFKLIPGDVGRPLADIATNLEYPALYDDAREVLRTLVFKETTVDSRDGRRLGVRIMPYRTSDNRIDGVVMTFTPLAQGGLG